MQPAASMPIIHLGMEYEDVDATMHTISTMDSSYGYYHTEYHATSSGSGSGDPHALLRNSSSMCY